MRSRTNLGAQNVVVTLCPLLLGGCFFFGDSKSVRQGQGDAGTASDDSCASAHCTKAPLQDAAIAKAQPEPFSMELAGIISQPVRWAGLDVTVKGARVARGLSRTVVPSQSANAALDFSSLTSALDQNKIYVELDLELRNKGAVEVDDRGVETWDLMLGDGHRVSSVDALGVTILPSDSATTSLHYQVDDTVRLEGAKLVLNGSDRQTFEPEEIPLDQAYVQEFPRRIPTLVGQMAQYHVDHSDASVRVDEAVYDANDAREGRALRGTRVVWLKVAFTTKDPEALNARDLRVIVDGRASAPQHGDNKILEAGTTRVLSVAFAVDKTATLFEIMVPDGTAEGQRFAVKVADTVLATDIP